MTAAALVALTGNTTLTLESVTCSGAFDTGISVTDAATLTMRDCSIVATDDAVLTFDGDVDSPTLHAENCVAGSSTPAWDLGGRSETLRGCSGPGLSVGGNETLVSDHVVNGVCTSYGMRLAGSRNLIVGGRIECSSEVGLWVDDARCSRATSIQIIADGIDANLSEYAVQVTGTNTEPETMLDGLDICGPGSVAVDTYGCNTGPFDCHGQPCADCAPGPECDDPEYESPSPCTDPLCWPPEEDRLPQLMGFCLANANLWDVQVPIKATRSIVLTFRELVAGAVSSLFTPSPPFDCLVGAELNVWTDDFGGAVGDTEVTLWDDTTGESWTLTCASTDAINRIVPNHELFGEQSIELTSRMRAEIVSVTTPVTTVEASVTLRLP